jgi:cysteinyl-tRNA synthetase
VTSKPFARFWIHGEHLLVDGEKMAKSKGNFYTLRDLLAKGYDAPAIRYLLLSVQYRKQLNFTLEGLEHAQRTLGRIKEFLFRLKSASLSAGSSAEGSGVAASSRTAFDEALDDDLNTSRALGVLFELIRACNTALDEGKLKDGDRAAVLQWFEEVDRRLAIVPQASQAGAQEEEVEALVAQRNAARRNRDFAASDRLRDELLRRGIVIEDTRDGTRWRRK